MDKLAVEVISPSFSRLKRKINNADEEKLQKCRERNRIHARNTRERKKIQVESIEQKIEDLNQEKATLCSQLVDSTVAGILMTLSSKDTPMLSTREGESSVRNSSDSNASYRSLQDIKSRISQELSDNEELDLTQYNIERKNAATVEEMDCMRKERNRIHAKKTRLRKKLILREMEQTLNDIQLEVDDLRVRVQLHHQNKSNSFSQSIENMTTTDDHDISYNIDNTDLTSSNSFVSETNNIQQPLFLFDPSNYFNPDDVLVTGFEPYSSSNDYLHNELRLPLPLPLPPPHHQAMNQPPLPPPLLHHYRDYLQDYEIMNPFDPGTNNDSNNLYSMIPMPYPPYITTYSNTRNIISSKNHRNQPPHSVNYPIDMSTVSFPLNPPPNYPPPSAWTNMIYDSPTGTSYYPYYLPAHPCSLFTTLLPPAAATTATLVTTTTSTTDASQSSNILSHAQTTILPALKSSIPMNQLPRNFSAPLSAYGIMNSSTSFMNRRKNESSQHISNNNNRSLEESSNGVTTTTTTIAANHDIDSKENQLSCIPLSTDSTLLPFPINLATSSSPTSFPLPPTSPTTISSLSYNNNYQDTNSGIKCENDSNAVCCDSNNKNNKEGEDWDNSKK